MDRHRAESPIVVALDRAATWLVDRWLALWNCVMVLYVALPIAAPLLLAVGAGRAANLIYWAYSYTCHQLPTHSWFLLGYQMAYCQRDTAIYTAMLVGGLLYARRRLWTRGLPLWAYLLLALPIAIDGGTATLGLRDSTPLLRSVTGVLFGMASAWFVYPVMDRALAGLGELPAVRPPEVA